MRVIFLNRYFFPDHSATSQMLSDLAFFLVDAGAEVCVVTSCQRYDDAAAVVTRVGARTVRVIPNWADMDGIRPVAAAGGRRLCISEQALWRMALT